MRPPVLALCAAAGLSLFAACAEDPSGARNGVDGTEESEDRAMSEEKRQVVVILGASYAAGWKPGSIAGLRYVNKGVGGEQSHEMLARFEQDVARLQPRAVILWGYINDIHRSSRDAIGQTKERAKRSFERMVELSRFHGIEPILATELTLREKNNWRDRLAATVGRWLSKKSYQDYVNDQVLELNGWLRQYAESNGILLLDLQPVLSDESGRRRREYAQDDGSHVTNAGYEALTSRFGGLLERHFDGE